MYGAGVVLVREAMCEDVTYRDDLARAIKKLHLLGSGFAVISAGNHRLVQSVPGELSMDHSTVFQKAEVLNMPSLFNLMLCAYHSSSGY